MRKKGLLRQIITFLLAIIAITSCAVTAIAGGLFWDGTGTSGGAASSNAQSSYSIAYDLPIQNVVGYRFTAVESDLTLIEGSAPVNVFVSAHASMMTDRNLCSPMRCKFEYYEHFVANEAIGAAMSVGSTDDKRYSYLETDLGFFTLLPSMANCSNIATAMDTWKGYDENVDIIARLVGYSNGLSGMRKDDKIIVEPLFAVALGGELVCCTVTEIAEYGRVLLGSNDSTGGALVNGYFGWISLFTNGRFANIMRTTNKTQTGLPFADTTEIADGSRVSFKTLITYGYGVGILCQSNNALPDRSVQGIYFTDANGNHYPYDQLPLNTTIRIWASFYTTGSLQSNLYYGTNDSDYMAVSSMNFLKSALNSSGGGTWGTSGTKYAVTTSGLTHVLLGTMSSSTAKGGYVHAAIFEPGTTTVTSKTEFSATNNQTECYYEFKSKIPDRDIEATYIKLYSPNGTEYPKTNGVYQIPYGNNVVVKASPKNNSTKATYENINVWWRAKAADSWAQKLSELTGSYYEAHRQKTLVIQLGNFNAYSTTIQTCSFETYIAGYDFGDAEIESNQNNNVATCQWQAVPSNYTLIVKPNGGTWGGSTSNSSFTLKQNATKQIADPTRTGYKFAGWKIEGGGSMVATTYTQGSNNCTITAQWTPITYNVAYNGNGATSGSMSNSTHTYDVAKALTANAFTKKYTVTYNYNGSGASNTTAPANYTFAGWSTSASGSKAYDNSASVKNLRNTSGTYNLYALWSGGAVTLPSPTRTGYSFAGWYDAASGGNKVGNGGASYTPGKNVTVYAHWTPITYTVTYNGNGATGGSTAKSTHTYDVQKSLTANGFTRTGYTFSGWNTVAGGTGTKYTDKQSVINLTATNGANINLYAQWTSTEVTYTVNHYQMSVDGSTSTLKDTETKSGASGATINPLSGLAKSYTGFTYSHSEIGGSKKTSTTISNGLVINLFYTPNTITFKYYSNYADTLNGNKPIDSSTQVLVAEWKTGINGRFPNNHWNYTSGGYALNRSGWHATGYWGTQPEGGILVGEDENFANYQALCTKYGVDINTPSTTINIYAQWDPNSITFKYYSNEADTVSGEKCTSDQQLIVEWTAKINGRFPDTHWNYTDGSYKMTRNRWYATGEWGTQKEGGILIDEDESFTSYQALCNKYGIDINAPSTTINIYAQWKPHYDIELSDIIFKVRDSNGNPQTLSSDQVQKIPIGTTVYVYYAYKNRSPVEVAITGYNTNGTVISYGGSTIYSIPGNDAILTIPAGSFVATPLGMANMGGSVYIDDVNVSDESSDIDANAKTNNTRTESYCVKFDVEIIDIYLTDYEGNVIDVNAKIPANSEVVVHHVYRNNTNTAFSVNGYDNAGNKITYNGLQKFAIPGDGTIDVVAGVMRTPGSVGAFALTGSVYRDGKTAATENDEWDLANNTFTLAYNTEVGPYLTPIEPNATYREGTEVITSYWLINPTNKNYTSTNKISIRIKIYDNYSGNLIMELSKMTVVPANEQQLVYFKWLVPHLSDYDNIKIIADLDLPEYDFWWGRVSKQYKYGPWSICYTPDTNYEEKQPSGWKKPASLADQAAVATWYEWEYSNGSFVKQNYGIKATAGTLTLVPQSKTAYQKNNMWYMKSGYGFTAEAANAVFGSYGSYKMPEADAYTGVQYTYMYYPEFQYLVDFNTVDTCELLAGKWVLYPFMDYGRIHFTPIWFPDGTYDAIMSQSDIWTPIGMIETRKTATIIINGDLYDDWYIQGQG